MPIYAKFQPYQSVRLKRDKSSISDHPFSQLDPPRPVTEADKGVIVEVYDVQLPGYTVEFFDEQGRTVDLLDLAEDEIEALEQP